MTFYICTALFATVKTGVSGFQIFVWNLHVTVSESFFFFFSFFYIFIDGFWWVPSRKVVCDSHLDKVQTLMILFVDSANNHEYFQKPELVAVSVYTVT